MLTNTAKLADALLTELSVVVDIVDIAVDDVEVELSCDTTGKCNPINRNSPKLGMGFGSLNAPAVLLVIWKMLTFGAVGGLLSENVVPSSVPASYGGNMVTFTLSRHVPLSHKSRLSIPMNQSGDGASIVIIDTLENFALTSTSIPLLVSCGPTSPLGGISFQAFFALIWLVISVTRVLVPPENKIIHELCLCSCNYTIHNLHGCF